MNEDENLTAHPSVGAIIEKYLIERRTYKSALARKLNTSDSHLLRRRKSNDASISWLWKLSIALHHNFIADIAILLPSDYSGGLKDAIAAKDQEIENLKAELQAMTKERDIYKDLLKK